MQIKAGDRFKCIEDVIMDGGEDIAYIKGHIYSSELAGCITNEFGEKEHYWETVLGEFNQHFLKIEENKLIRKTAKILSLSRSSDGSTATVCLCLDTVGYFLIGDILKIKDKFFAITYVSREGNQLVVINCPDDFNISVDDLVHHVGINGDNPECYQDLEGAVVMTNGVAETADVVVGTYKRQFESGAVRDSNEGKSRPDLISPYMLDALGRVLSKGAKNYGARNWEKGMPNEVLKESAARHYVAWMMDKEDEDHAAQLIFNVMAWIHFRDKDNV